MNGKLRLGELEEGSYQLSFGKITGSFFLWTASEFIAVSK